MAYNHNYTGLTGEQGLSAFQRNREDLRERYPEDFLHTVETLLRACRALYYCQSGVVELDLSGTDKLTLDLRG